MQSIGQRQGAIELGGISMQMMWTLLGKVKIKFKKCIMLTKRELRESALEINANKTKIMKMIQRKTDIYNKIMHISIL